MKSTTPSSTQTSAPMPCRRGHQSVGILALLVVSLAISSPRARAQVDASNPAVSARMRTEFAAILKEQQSRTPAQRKLNTQLHFANQQAQKGFAVAGAPLLRSRAVPEIDGRYKVRIKADVTPELLAAIKDQGGNVTHSYPQYRTIYAALPLSSMEPLAARSDVRFIGLPIDFQHNVMPSGAGSEAAPVASIRPLPKAVIGTALPEDQPDVNDPEGDEVTTAVYAREEYNVTGAGVKVGVLSDSIDNSQGSYEAAVSAGYVPTVNIIPGQAGSPNGTAEGLAMLEVVHRLAPGATLYFATGDGDGDGNGEEEFANSITTMADDGCSIIVDDVSYHDEYPFQDGIISQAVNALSARGVMYFSSAGNRGNEDSGTSSTWEGDFVCTNNDGILDFGVEAGRRTA